MYAEMTTQRAVGYVFIAVVVIGGILLVISQMAKGRKEAGSEIELAANRGPGQTDEELEGPRLNLALWSAFGLLMVIALALPIYWLAEGGRQAGAVKDFRATFIAGGLDVYTNKAQCVNCHGPQGVGGSTSYVITDDAGKYVNQVTWKAPALNTVLWRFSQDEVTHIINYGRPGTPMPAWGSLGGGPLSDQQISNVIDYLWSVQLTNAQMQTQVMTTIAQRNAGLAARLDAVQKANAKALEKDPTAYECTDGKFQCLDQADQLLLGEIIFNMGDVASGGYDCARCHVAGASYDAPYAPVEELGRGRYGPNLAGVENDLTFTEQFNLVMTGSQEGKLYGANHQGSGNMPGFGLNANNGDSTVPQLGPNGMLTAEQVYAIVTYERHLDTQTTFQKASPTATTTTTVGSTTTTTQAGK
jgi:mono/diheme cytochrome c family protein